VHVLQGHSQDTQDEYDVVGAVDQEHNERRRNLEIEAEKMVGFFICINPKPYASHSANFNSVPYLSRRGAIWSTKGGVSPSSRLPECVIRHIFQGLLFLTTSQDMSAFQMHCKSLGLTLFHPTLTPMCLQSSDSLDWLGDCHCRGLSWQTFGEGESPPLTPHHP